MRSKIIKVKAEKKACYYHFYVGAVSFWSLIFQLYSFSACIYTHSLKDGDPEQYFTIHEMVLLSVSLS